MQRRTFLEACLAGPMVLAAGSLVEAADLPANPKQKKQPMYGLISQLKATEGDRDKLVKILLDGTREMPGCKLYAVATDTADKVSIWITEIWESDDAHKASLKLPAVQQAMTAGKPLIAGFGERRVVTPMGGFGVG